MTTLREAAQQALQVLERAGEELRWQAIGQVQRDLRAALAKQVRAAMTYEYTAYVSRGNVDSGEEVLRVTAEGAFIWGENADEMIASGDFSQHPALRHVLKALRENERLQDMLYEQLGELTALRAEKQMRKRVEELKEQPR